MSAESIPLYIWALAVAVFFVVWWVIKDDQD